MRSGGSLSLRHPLGLHEFHPWRKNSVSPNGWSTVTEPVGMTTSVGLMACGDPLAISDNESPPKSTVLMVARAIFIAWRFLGST
jgi:hypothetical protein